MEKKLTAKKTKKEATGDTQKKAGKKDFLVVGLGASAGGVKALQEFFATMPPNSGMAFVAILHLSPEHESNLAQILQAQTQMKVTQVTETVKVEPNNVYVIPPNRQLEMVDGVIRPAEAVRPAGHRIAIDVFFRTLADAYQKNAVCVVMSGTGSDGTLGLKRVKESNGFAIVQDPEDAEYDSMPRSAINTQLADWVLPVNQMPDKLIHFRESSERLHLTNGADAEKVGEEIQADESLREVLTLLRVRTGHDFSNYKMPTLVRRIARHLQIHELEDIPSYLELLRNNPNEIHSLLKNLLINVTNFFRDKLAFESLEAEVIPNLFAGKTGKDTVRVWSCGCASGEEAYSLAMILSEYADKLSDPPKFQVFASDVDDEAIAEAREHLYPESIEADVAPERLKRFFIREGSFYRVKKELREAVLFAPHNVLRDPPFSRLDLITCRNLLIYLNRDTQERVLQIFHFALAPHGYLFLGSSETAESVATLFAPVDKKQRIYSRRVAPIAQNTLPMMPVAGRWEVRLPDRKTQEQRDRASSLSEIHYKLLENYAPSSVLVNQDFDIVYLSGAAGKFLRFSGGEPSRNLLKAINPDLLPDLRAALFTAQREHKSSEFPNIRLRLNGEETIINLIVRAVDVADEASDFLLVIFEERLSSSALKATDEEVEKITNKDEAMETVVRRLEEDLQRTKEHLRFTIEQHETTVEELKASNEELQAINEELRSASEELETSKEELQSVNEELTTVNHELKDKIDETSRINSDLSNLMASTDIATIFLDKNLLIKRYTPPVQEIFNITPSDAGRPLEHFTHKLNYDDLPKDAAQVLRNLLPIEREISDKNNLHYLARFAPYRTIDDRIDGVVLNFIDITDRKNAEEAVRLSEERLQKAIDIETVGVIFFNNEFEITECNEAFAQMSGYTRQELKAGRFSWQKFTPDRFVEISSRALVELNTAGIATPYEKEYVRKDGTRFWALFAAKRIGKNEIVEFVTDITEQKRAEEILRESEKMRQIAVEGGRMGTWQWDTRNDRIRGDAVFMALYGFPPSNDHFPLATFTERMGPEAAAACEAVAASEHFPGEEFDGALQLADGSWVRWRGRVDLDKPHIIYGVSFDISEQKRDEERQAFLLKLGDALRPVASPLEIEAAVTRLALDHFAADRCYYCTIENGSAIARTDAVRGDLPSVAGVYPLQDFAIFRSAIEAGKPYAVPDVHTTDTLDEGLRQICLQLGIVSNIIVPVIKDGVAVGLFCLVQSVPREWTATETDLAAEVAERTWAAIERARAEEALSESEEKYRTLFDSIDEGVATGEVIFNESGKAVDLLYLEHNPALTRQTGLTGIVGKRVTEILPDLEAFWFETYERVLRTGEPERFEYQVVAFDSWFDFFISRVGGSESRTIVSVYNNITERKRHEEKQAFLLELSDALRPLADAEEIRLASATILGRHLKANRVAYAENVPEEEQFEVTQNYTDGASEVTGRFRYADYGADILEQLQSGNIRVQPDIQNDSRLSDTEKRSLAEAEVGASLNVPLVKNKALAAFLGVNYLTAHDFKPDEIELVKETAERMWAAVLRARAEDALRDSEERMRIAVEAAEMATWDWDLIKNEVVWNERHFLLFGMKPSKKPQRPEAFSDRVHPDDREWVVKRLEQAVETNTTFQAEFRAVRADNGEIRWMEGYGHVVERQNGKPSRMSGVMSDITNRKRAEEAVRISEERLQLILKSITDYAVITSDTEGIINGWNTGAENTFGWTAEEVVGKSCSIIFLPEDRKARVPEREMETALREEIAVDERWHVRKDGSRFFASGTVSPIRNGEFDGFVKITSDQTARMEAEKILQEKEMLRRLVAGQEDERRRIARDIHDHFGQQMTALRLKLNTLQRMSDEEELSREIDEAERIAGHLDADIDFIAWELRPAALDDLGLRVTLNNFVREWSHHTNIQTEFHTSGLGRTPRDFEVETNVYRIAQEVLNNIYKHARAKFVSVILERRGDTLVLIIEDDGAGFNVADKDNRKKGIGLTGMEERARIVGGEFEIESKKGAGTTVYARVPLKPKAK